MTLSSESNTINAVGIFGRMKPEAEKYFLELEKKYSGRSPKDEAYGIFNHLSLVINNNVALGKLPIYLDLLKELKAYLPLKIKTSGVKLIDGQHVALTFDLEKTKKIREIASEFFKEGIIETYYTKVVWFVPPENQEDVIKELNKIKEMEFDDFVLVANRQDDEHMIYSANRYK